MKNIVKQTLIVIILCLMIVVYGFVVISERLPKFIKDKSSFKINYSISPFDFRVDISDYSLYLNGKVVSNMIDTSNKLFNNISDNMQKGTSNVRERTSQVFKNMEDKINNIINNKVK